MAVHLAEGLHLHGAGEGDEGVGQQVEFLREKAHCKQQQNFRKNDDLPPMECLGVLQLDAGELGHQNAAGKGEKGDKIAQRRGPLAAEQAVAQQHDVARLGVGVHFAAEKVGISVLQAAGKGQKHGDEEGLGHLAPAFVPGVGLRLHGVPPLF